MRAGAGTYILIILLVLLLFGLVSIGDILSVAFYIIMGFLALIIIAFLIFRYRINRIRRRMEENGEEYRTYRWGNMGSRPRTQGKSEGDVTVERTPSSYKKKVSNEVGEYVEYEDIREGTTNEDTGE